MQLHAEQVPAAWVQTCRQGEAFCLKVPGSWR